MRAFTLSFLGSAASSWKVIEKLAARSAVERLVILQPNPYRGALLMRIPPLSPQQDALMLSSTVSFFKTELMELQEDVTQVNAARAEDAQGTSHASPSMPVYGEKVDISRQNLTFSKAKVDVFHAKSLLFSLQQQTETVFFCFPEKSDIVAAAVSFLLGG